jgi:hypothetical protein
MIPIHAAAFSLTATVIQKQAEIDRLVATVAEKEVEIVRYKKEIDQRNQQVVLPASGCDANGHFNIPEGTTTILGQNPYRRGGADSWAEWEVDITTVRSVTIPNSVTSIGEFAFAGCSLLGEVSIPASVTTIDWGAFQECTSLVEVSISTSVTTIGECSFQDCLSLVEVSIPTSVTTIGEHAFYGCTLLVNVLIPTSVTRIEGGAFSGCSALVGVLIPDSVISIGGNAFRGCSSLVEVSIPTSVINIGKWTFYECSSLVEVLIPTSVARIEEGAFFGCSSLVEVSIPNSVTRIGRYAFQRCSSCTTLLVQPADAGAAAATTWSALLDISTIDDDDADADAGDEEDDATGPLLSGVTRVWAPDAVIALLTGPFTGYSTLAEMPRGLRAAPDAKTWAAVQLWRWWSPPTGAGYADQERTVCRPRLGTLFNTMLAGVRAVNANALPPLPQELWVVIFGFLKHNQPPAYQSL